LVRFVIKDLLWKTDIATEFYRDLEKKGYKVQ